MPYAQPAPQRTSPRPVGPRPPPTSPPRSPVALAPAGRADYTGYGLVSDVGINASRPSQISRGTMSRGTVLHKGFYDLLSILPNTASQLRGWSNPAASPTGNETNYRNGEHGDIAGPRYDEIPPPAFPPPIAPPKSSAPQSPLPTPPRGLMDRVSAFLPPLEPQTTRFTASISAYFASAAPPIPPPKKSRRVSKDMISSPTGFMYVSPDHVRHTCRQCE